MNLFDTFINYLSIPLILIIAVLTFRNLYKNRRNKNIIFKTVVRFIILAILIVVPIQFMNSSLGQDIVQKYRTQRFSKISFSFSDSLNYESHYMDVMFFKRRIDHITRHVNRPASDFLNERGSLIIIDKYNSFKNSDDSIKHDIGCLFLAFHYLNLELAPKKVDTELSELYDSNQPYINYIKGTNDFHKRSWKYFQSAESNLLASIDSTECIKDSYENLARLYFYFSQQDQLNALMDDPKSSPYVPEWAKRARYLSEFNWIKYWQVRMQAEFDYWHILGVSSALILLMLWLQYLRKLDIYEPEKKRYLLITFIISIISMQLLYPIHDVLWSVFDYHRPLSPISDLWYCVISIGMVEELVKIIPVLIMLRFTKQINEPFDYILYAAVSGLGFAFIENIGYFGESILNVSGRGIYCCLAHMAFSATIGYGLMLAKYRGYNKYLMFGIFFLVASFLHGFYDFWIMDWWAIHYSWMSDLIFLLCIYLFGYYVNNSLNNSPFYQKDVRLDRSKLVFQAIFIGVAVIMTGYVSTTFIYTTEFSNEILFGNFSRFAFYICFIALTMGSVKLIKGYISPITLPFRNYFKPRKQLLDISGMDLQMQISSKFKLESDNLQHPSILNQRVVLKERTIVSDYTNSYTAQLTQPLSIDGYENHLVLLIPHWYKAGFNGKNKTLTNVYLIKEGSDLNQPFLLENDFVHIGKLFCLKITEPQIAL